MSKFRKRPVVIEAFQWTGDNQFDLMRWRCLFPGEARWQFNGSCIFIDTPEGDMRADPGDWIITGVKGEFYPCDDDVFSATYEPVEDAP